MNRVSVEDRDFNFLMERIAEYVCSGVFKSYKKSSSYDDLTILKKIYDEFLTYAHVYSETKKYILSELNISVVSPEEAEDYEDDGAGFYFQYSESDEKMTFFNK